MTPSRASDPFRLACSGTVDPSGLVGPLIGTSFRWIDRLFGAPQQIVSGCARGVDTIWIEMAAVHWPDAAILLITPAAPHNAHMVAYLHGQWAPRVRILHMPPARDYPTAYMQRNDQIEHNADALCAFPPTKSEVLRDGTWATIRRFRKRDKPIYRQPVLPNVRPTWENL